MAHKQYVSQIMQPDGTLKCAVCGGSNFRARRSMARKLTVGAASLLGSTNEAWCQTCSTKYKMGSPPVAAYTPPRPDTPMPV